MKESTQTEMLTVSRKQVQEMYAYNEDILSLDPTHSGAILLKKKLQDLFGSKCLPDEAKDDTKDEAKKPKPVEPKYKLWDLVVYDEAVHKIVGVLPCAEYYLSGHEYAVSESDLEPYTEPEGESRNLSQETANCDKQFDNILKDSFRGHNRLHIAAMAMQGYLSSNGSGDPKEIAHYALAVADALIKASEKGGEK